MKFQGFAYEDGRIVDTAYLNGTHFGYSRNDIFKAEIKSNEVKVSLLNHDARLPSGHKFINHDEGWEKNTYQFLCKFRENPDLTGEPLAILHMNLTVEQLRLLPISRWI